MKVKVILGTVRAEREYGVGEELDLKESEAKAMIQEGVVEEVKEKAKPKAKPEKKPKAKPEKEPKPEEETGPEPEPSMDWTRKELDEYAKAHGVEEPGQFESKRELLEAVKQAQEPEKGGEGK